MRTRLAIRLDRILERWLPERRIFLRSDRDTRFLRLSPTTQAAAIAGTAAILGWTAIASAILMMDSLGAGSFRDQALRDRLAFQERLDAIAAERDARTAEIVEARAGYDAALRTISQMQSELLASEARRQELQTGLEVVQATLRRTLKQKQALEDRVAALEAAVGAQEAPANGDDIAPAVDLLAETLRRTAEERDRLVSDAEAALRQAEDMELELTRLEERTDRIFRQLEDAMTVSIEPLDDMFRKVGLDADRLISEVKRNYSGQGGPLTPIATSTRGEPPSEEVLRANRILHELDRLNLYRIAIEQVPLGIPVKDRFRYTSGFGPRWGRMHKGTDFAAPLGTPVYATADGVVTFAGWSAGYGKLVKIRHAFGFETRYAHNSKLFVKAGERVSRGQKIAAMGNTGRSTGTHLHYEVRVGGKAVNPMTYIKAARDVF